MRVSLAASSNNACITNMIELTVGQLLDNYKLSGVDCCIYAVRSGTAIYYVGKSESKRGVIGRLDQHLWLQRRSGGNYILIYVADKNVKEVCSRLQGFIKKIGAQGKDGEMVLHTMTTGLDMITGLHKRKLIRWGANKDRLGKFILDGLPSSRNWQIQLYTLQDCKLAIQEYVQNSRLPLRIDIQTAELAMIHLLRPQLNIAGKYLF
jgi:hypothetical protein